MLSPDPNVFGHSNPLAGLKKGGVFIIQSNLGDETWASFPTWAQKFIVDNDIRVFHLDAFQIARDEAGSADLQLRMQGIAFQGAFFAASPVMANAGLTEERLFGAIEAQLQSKFGGKGAAVVQNNLKVVKRGFIEMHEIVDKQVGVSRKTLARKDAGLPVMLRQLPEADGKVADIHRFWEQTGNFYATGKGSDNLVDPFIGTGMMPAATGVYRDMTGIRFEHPVWNPKTARPAAIATRSVRTAPFPAWCRRWPTFSTPSSTTSRRAARRRVSCVAPCAMSRSVCARRLPVTASPSHR